MGCGTYSSCRRTSPLSTAISIIHDPPCSPAGRLYLSGERAEMESGERRTESKKESWVSETGCDVSDANNKFSKAWKNISRESETKACRSGDSVSETREDSLSSRNLLYLELKMAIKYVCIHFYLEGQIIFIPQNLWFPCQTTMKRPAMADYKTQTSQKSPAAKKQTKKPFWFHCHREKCKSRQNIVALNTKTNNYPNSSLDLQETKQNVFSPLFAASRKCSSSGFLLKPAAFKTRFLGRIFRVGVCACVTAVGG